MTKTFALFVAAVLAISPGALLACQGLCAQPASHAFHCHTSPAVAVRIVPGTDQPCPDTAGGWTITTIDRAKRAAGDAVLATVPRVAIVTVEREVAPTRVRPHPRPRIPLVLVLRI